jgi:hypothetical protein
MELDVVQYIGTNLHRLVEIPRERSLHRVRRVWPWSHTVCGRRSKVRLIGISTDQVVLHFELTGIH